MGIDINFGSLTNAISTDEIDQFVTQVTDDFRHQVVAVMEQFTQSDPTPQRTLDLENTLYDFLRETGRTAIEQLFSRLEPAIQQLPATIKYRGNSHRRLTEKSRRADVLTRFGKISFLRARYRRGRAGRTSSRLRYVWALKTASRLPQRPVWASNLPPQVVPNAVR